MKASNKYYRRVVPSGQENIWKVNGERGQLHEWYFLFFFLSFGLLAFLGLHPRHLKVPRLGVQSELQLLAYITATATRDLGCICDLHQSSQQCWILNPLSEARDQTCVLTLVRFTNSWATTGTPESYFLSFFLFLFLEPKEVECKAKQGE